MPLAEHKTYLVLVRGPHVLDNLFRLGLGHATLLGDDLAGEGVDFTGHVGGVTTDVEVGLLLKQSVDFGGTLAEAVLDVDLLTALTGERGDELELVAEGLLIGLGWVNEMVSEGRLEGRGRTSNSSWYTKSSVDFLQP